jgi:hypothetical protein
LFQKIFQTKYPGKPISSTVPRPHIQNKKNSFNLGELISFLPIVHVFGGGKFGKNGITSGLPPNQELREAENLVPQLVILRMGYEAGTRIS